MNKRRRVLSLLALTIFILSLVLSGCAAKTKGLEKEGEYIIEAEQIAGYLGQENVVVVDMQKGEDFAAGHVPGAVNISRAAITIDEPFPNLVAPASEFEAVMGKNGIGNDTLVIIYDATSNMDAARLWWTLKFYGHNQTKVISGGIEAIKAAGVELENKAQQPSPKSFKAAEPDLTMLATIKEVRAQLNEPDAKTVFLDTRTAEEYAEGTIPGSILFDYAKNNYADGTYRPAQHLALDYIEAGVLPEQTIIMYCKTSVRAAQTYLALYNAGYRNLKLYDGAWVEYSSYPTMPIQLPEESSGPALNSQDMS